MPYHVSPKYWRYKGGFANITICKNCGRTGLYEDQHPVNPCPECGSEVVDRITGKWNGSNWDGMTLNKVRGWGTDTGKVAIEKSLGTLKNIEHSKQENTNHPNWFIRCIPVINLVLWFLIGFLLGRFT